MKRIIALTVGSLLFLTACSRNNTGVAELSPSPSFPPIKGPSAVFTATPDPNATPCPTVTFPTRDPNATPYVSRYTPRSYTTASPGPTLHPGIAMMYADGWEVSQDKIRKMLTYSFDADDTYNTRPQSDFVSEEEYVEYIKAECEKKYKENFDYLQSHKVDAWYMKYSSEQLTCADSVYIKITNEQMINQINRIIQDCPAKKNSEYSVREPFLPTTGWGAVIKFYIEKDGKMTRMFETDNDPRLGIRYFKVEPSCTLPYCSERIPSDFVDYWDNLLNQLIADSYITQSEVNLVFD